MTKLGEYEEIFLDSLRALGWTIEPPGTEVYEPKVDDRVLVTFSENDTTFGTVTEVNGSNDFTVLCELTGGVRPVQVGRKHLSPLDEFDVLDCPRVEHAGVDCPGDACRFAADQNHTQPDLEERLHIELAYRLRTVAAHYRLRGKHGMNTTSDFIDNEIDAGVKRLSMIAKESLAPDEDSGIPTAGLPVQEQGQVPRAPKFGDRVRVGDAVTGDRFGEIVDDRDPLNFTVQVDSDTYVLTVSRSRVTHPDEVPHDAIVGWGEGANFLGRCSCGRWRTGGSPDAVRTEATTHAGSFRDVSRVDT